MWFSQLVSKSAPKIIAVGKNYLKHAIEMGGTEVPKQPLIFMKPWSSLAYAPKQLNLSQSGRTGEIHHEIELGVVIGKSGYQISKGQAHNHVKGYILALDLTDRDLQSAAKKAGFPWDLSKGQDNFCPVSEFIDAKEIKDPYNVEIQLSINDKIRQKTLCKEMHFKIDDIISYTSQYVTINEGDIILTGTPEGVGPIKPGDRVSGFLREDGKILGRLLFEVK